MKPRILKDHIVFVAPPSDLPKLKAIFPNLRYSLTAGQQVCAVPLSLESARLLRNMGIEAPSPIRTEYDWPIIPGRTPGWWQIDTAEFLTLNPRAFCLSLPRCVDAETEYLTPTGWRKFDTYVDGTLVAQWNAETRQAEFVVPMEYVKMPCSEMIHFKTAQNIDQMLTPNHRVVYETTSGNIKETTAESIFVRGNTNGSGWHGKIPVTFRAPDTVGISLSDAEIRVMVAVIADGYFGSPSTNRCQLRLKKARKKDRLRELLHAANIQFTERTRDYHTAKGFTVFQIYAPLRHKEFVEYWWSANRAQLEIIVSEVPYWDGTFRKAEAVDFSSASKRTADFIQYAAVATGRSATIGVRQYVRNGQPDKPMYVVHIQKDGKPVGLTGNNADGSRSLQATRGHTPAGNTCYCFEVPSSYLIMRRNGRVFITGNTRKTHSTLWAVDYMQRIGAMGKCLVVAPLSTLEIVWGETIWYNFPRKKYAVLHGTAAKRKELLKKDCGIYVINHDGVGIIQEELAKRKDITHIVIDELRVFFSSKTTRWKSMKSIITPERTAWGLTGTPTPNEPTDAYGQMKLIKPENFNGSFTAFKQATMQQFGPFRWVPRRGHEAIVQQALSPAIRFTREVVTDMQPQIIERHAELSPQQAKHLNELMRQAATEIDGSMITAVNAAVLVQKIVQAACGAVYDTQGNVVEMDFGPRLKVIEELIEENNDSKTIVFFPFTGVLDAFARELGKKWSVAVVDGGVSSGRRTQIFKDFQEKGSPHVLVAHPGCMAHGLELTKAALIIYGAPITSADTYGQACARIDGGGQKLRIDIAHVSATAAERKIYAALREKRKLQDLVCELFEKK